MTPSTLDRVYTGTFENDMGCWVWTGGRYPNNYGRMRVSNVSVRVHRVAYELLIGKIPRGLEPDHLCRNRLCVNPSHLEPVTRKENLMRGLGPQAARYRHANRKACKNGHLLSEDNLTISRQWHYRTGVYYVRRQCKACNDVWCRRYRNKVKERAVAN